MFVALLLVQQVVSHSEATIVEARGTQVTTRTVCPTHLAPVQTTVVVGIQGEPGPAGLRGPVGPRGPSGQTGSAGPAGTSVSRDDVLKMLQELLQQIRIRVVDADTGETIVNARYKDMVFELPAKRRRSLWSK